MTLQISPDLPRALQKIDVAAAGSGLGGSVRVELQVDGARLGAFDAPPYRANWQIAPGRHLFRVVALDPSGKIVAQDEGSIVVEGAGGGP